MHVPQTTIPIIESQIELWGSNCPLLSVIILCYNYGQYVREALQSVRSQTFRDLEIIVVDDGSTDALTLSVLVELQREGVRVLRQEHSGPARALNLGISAASGKYVCCLSADDTVEPTYFEKCLVLLESNPGISFAYPLVRTFGAEQRIGVTEPFDLRLLLIYNHVCGSAVFLRSAWETVGGFDSSMPAYEDWDFWIRLGKTGFRGRLIPEPLFNWRRHAQTVGSRVDQRRPELIARIRANHADLFSDSGQIETIQQAYRDYRVPNPLVNLASSNQYAQFEGPVVLIMVSEPPGISEQVFELLPKLKEKRVTLITAITSLLTGGLESRLQTVSSMTYDLTALLALYNWRKFIVNLIRTRSIQFVLMFKPEMEYEWANDLKTQTSASVLEEVHDLELALGLA